MQQFIGDCLKPIWELQWLKEISIDPILQNNILFYIAYTDKRLMLA